MWSTVTMCNRDRTTTMKGIALMLYEQSITHTVHISMFYCKCRNLLLTFSFGNDFWCLRMHFGVVAKVIYFVCTRTRFVSSICKYCSHNIQFEKKNKWKMRFPFAIRSSASKLRTWDTCYARDIRIECVPHNHIAMYYFWLCTQVQLK